jgi:hypothetical protein
MPAIIYDHDAIRDAANLLNGADMPMNTVAQPMAIVTGQAIDENHMTYDIYSVPVVGPVDPVTGEYTTTYDYGC